MQFRELGDSGISVSTIGMGCWAIVGGLNWGHQEKKESLEALRAAYEAGITFFDTAEMYGDGYSEQLIAEALGSERHNIILGSKVSPENFSPANLVDACERSLKNLQTDYLDFYQLHWPNRDVAIADSIEAMETLKRDGKIRAFGVSNFGPNDLHTSLATGSSICSNQMAYSLLFRAIEYDVVPICTEHNISILCYSPLLHGLLSGKFASIDEIPEDRARTRHFDSNRWPQARHGEAGAEDLLMQTIDALRPISEEAGESMANLALAWLQQQPGVTSVIMGARNAGQAKRNARAADIVLSEDVINRMSACSNRLKEHLGSNADMWQSSPRIR